MAARIRMKRFGSRNSPKWRIVVADARSPRDGRFIEEIGYYDALPKEEKFVIKQDRFDHWTKAGAEVSASVASLVKKQKRAAKAK